MIRLYVAADLAQGVALGLDQGQSHYLTSVMRRAVGDEVLGTIGAFVAGLLVLWWRRREGAAAPA